jgi:hypothetical protein
MYETMISHIKRKIKMAQFTKTNGDYLPVLRLDAAAYTNSGLNAIQSGASVQPQGPKLDFFTISAASTGAFSGAQVNVMVQTVQQLATVYIYEYTDGSPDTVAFAVYPTGSWAVDNSLGASSNVVAAINAALTAAGVANTTTGSASASFTN